MKTQFTQVLIEPIAYQSPQKLFERFAHKKWHMLMDSANAGQDAYGTNRYSYILIDPVECFSYRSQPLDQCDPLSILRQKMSTFKLQALPGIPPFQGGMAGYLSYDLIYRYYPVTKPPHGDITCPEVCVGFYDLVCSFDHLERKAYLVSCGFPERDEAKRLKRARNRLNWFKAILEEKVPPPNAKRQQACLGAIQSNFTKAQYLQAVNQTIEYILRGDIFEANLSQRFLTTVSDSFDHYQLFKALSFINPSPFAAFLNLGQYKIISASPERFLRLQDRQVEARPIKGTRIRSTNPNEDEQHIQDLLRSEKDFAENIMIVDLMRNDLSIVCEDDSVIVTQLCAHERYPTVHHLVSVIKGTLKQSEDAFSLLKATFPGGSITGAPKIRAMQIISSLEPHHRGPYCGNLLLIGFDGNLDSSIIIRTFVAADNVMTFHAGGAVVLDSNPIEEYEETLIKVNALKMALQHDFID